VPNRRAVTRGGPLEQAILQAIRQGHTIRAACGAAGVPVRTYYNFAQRSAAHRHDREVAEQDAERRLVRTVLDAADGGDVKAAQWLLERRWPQVYGALQRIDARVQGDYHHEVDVEVLSLAQRYSGLTEDEVAAEVKRLAWVDGTGQERTHGGGGDTTVPLLPASTDATPETAPNRAESADEAEPQGDGRLSPPQPAEVLEPYRHAKACPHCEGDLRHHQPACPVFYEDGRLRIPWAPSSGGDPR
jgi:hypothetical protein